MNLGTKIIPCFLTLKQDQIQFLMCYVPEKALMESSNGSEKLGRGRLFPSVTDITSIAAIIISDTRNAEFLLSLNIYLKSTNMKLGK